ncbi:electron transport complex subunit RsxC [Methylocaldum sp.]|uniref:electron transport complex subunit RsxC n=1 Tax=Methylocaldum sp. TaxID=1969727 RepID=UPI002D3227E8|nr:electron transport complex subunit RsxC [Methylocaldum sp.]HYE37555.1 electron transport complex subunit RsxC [Methylocaldum sp.]
MLPLDIHSLWRGRGKIRGGVHPESHKEATADQPIVTAFPLPNRLYLPLQQHLGQPAEPVVRVGDKVLKGQLLAASQGPISAPVHASTSGTIAEITEYPAPHPSGLPTPTLVLEPDGEDRWMESAGIDDPFSLTPEDICARVDKAGIVGMGGAAFPSAMKLNLGWKTRIRMLIINGGECEPYLTCDDRLMRERALEIIEGVRIMLHGLQCPTALIAIEDNKPEAYAAMAEAARKHGRIEVVLVPSLYPMGWEKNLVTHLTGREIPAGGRPTDVGVLLHNVATAYAVQQAIRYGRPLISRVVTVSGEAVERPRNVEAPLGTLLSELLAFCGHRSERTARYVMGGPMMGDQLPHVLVPVVKRTSGILALTPEELHAADTRPCIRCGRCVSACPVGLLPLEMMTRIRAGQFDAAVGFGLRDCINCSSCSYVCPSRIPLVQYFKYASGELAARREAQQKTEQTNRLAEEKQRRLERVKQEAAQRRAQAQSSAQGTTP